MAPSGWESLACKEKLEVGWQQVAALFSLHTTEAYGTKRAKPGGCPRYACQCFKPGNDDKICGSGHEEGHHLATWRKVSLGVRNVPHHTLTRDLPTVVLCRDLRGRGLQRSEGGEGLQRTAGVMSTENGLGGLQRTEGVGVLLVWQPYVNRPMCRAIRNQGHQAGFLGEYGTGS